MFSNLNRILIVLLILLQMRGLFSQQDFNTSESVLLQPHCFDGLVNADGICLRNPLILANRKDIRICDGGKSDAKSIILASDSENIVAVDFLYEDKSIFFAEVSQDVIKMVSLFSNDTNATTNVIKTGPTLTEGLACDWLNRKLYWTDSENKRIEVANLNGEFRKVLYWTELDHPRAIVLDPLNGYMYWTDTGEYPKIERGSMDGNQLHRATIIQNNIYWPNGLSVDYEESRIYWVDAKLKYIHSCNMDGSNRRVVLSKNIRLPYDITVYDNTLYWTDSKDRRIYSCDKKTGKNYTRIQDAYSPMGIKVFSAKRQPKDQGEHICNSQNGGCSHLCLRSPIEPYYTCACPTGIKLKQDNKTCNEGYDQLLLIARGTGLRLLSLDTPDYTDVDIELMDIKQAVAIDYDPVDNYVYWTDALVKAISRVHLDGTGQETVINESLINPDGIAVDWIARNLYWTDQGTKRIEVSRLNGTSRLVLVVDDLENPRAITLDPVTGYMYWTDWGSKPKIERAHLDGSGRVSIVNSWLGWPNGIAVDHEEQLVYWGDAKVNKIEVANVDGTGRRVLVKHNLPHLFGFSLLGDYIYWSDWQKRSIERINKRTGNERKTILSQRPDLMGLAAVSTNNIGTNPCADNNGGCSHLCLMKPLPFKPVCACPVNLDIGNDNKTCIEFDGFLLFSDGRSLNTLSLVGNHLARRLPIKGIKKAVSMDFDMEEKRVYWVDLKLKTINRGFMNGNEVETIIRYGVKQPVSIAVDWVSKNIYWIDRHSKQIEVARTDGTSRRVIVWKHVHRPKTLAVDPPNGYMYWSDWSGQGRIERASLDGTSRLVLIPNVSKVNVIVLDFMEKKIYWTRKFDTMIEFANIDGTNRKQIIASKIYKIRSFTLYNDLIFWHNWNQKTIMRADKRYGGNQTTLTDEVESVYDMKIYHPSRQAGSNSCHDNNGDCSYLCIANPAVDGKIQRHQCSCPTHYALGPNNRSCSAPTSYLLYSQRNTISRLIMDENDTDTKIPEVVLPIPNLRNVKALSYDPIDEDIYWIEGKTNIIKRATSNGTYWTTVVSNDNKDYRPYDMDIDPYARSLYWTCSKRNVINITRLDGTPLGVVIQGDNEKPRSIVLNPRKRLMYWVNMVQQPTIESAAMDGTDRRTLISTLMGIPDPLFIDVDDETLYWADEVLQRIEYYDITSGNRKVLVSSQIVRPTGMAVFGKYLYWIDRDSMLMSRVDKSTGQERSVFSNRFRRASDLHVAVNNLPDHLGQLCLHSNGGCSHICVANGERDIHCACPLGFYLEMDEKTCSDKSKCSASQFSCVSGEIHCIPLEWRCDYSIECQDNSDELGCPICLDYQFKCVNDQCIHASYVCDGYAHCNDQSDETHCARNCIVGQFACLSGNISCIPGERRCDNFPDCQDGSDEADCPLCHNQLFCTNGECFDAREVCDGTPNCKDAIDEKYCSRSPTNNTDLENPPSTFDTESNPMANIKDDETSSDDPLVVAPGNA